MTTGKGYPFLTDTASSMSKKAKEIRTYSATSKHLKLLYEYSSQIPDKSQCFVQL